MSGTESADGEVAERAASRSAADARRELVLEVTDLTKHFTMHRRGRGELTGRSVVHAVDGVSFGLYAGEVTALVGESGSGKSTVARLLAQLQRPTSGSIRLFGKPARARYGRAFRRYVRGVQLVFQDPFSSLNPIHTVGYVLGRPLRIHGYARSRRERDAGVSALLAQVELTPSAQFAAKYPHELSGGQRQRVAVARALAARPKVILADEPVSMLDVSIRLSILNLLQRLVTESRLALLYITHDIASARYFATTTLVMYGGQLIEGGPSEDVMQAPAHPYTQLLIACAPDPDHSGASTGLVTGEPPSLITPPAGCRFHPRCPHAMDVCRQSFPPRSEPAAGHWVHCWLHTDAGRPSRPRAETPAS